MNKLLSISAVGIFFLGFLIYFLEKEEKVVQPMTSNDALIEPILSSNQNDAPLSNRKSQPTTQAETATNEDKSATPVANQGPKSNQTLESESKAEYQSKPSKEYIDQMDKDLKQSASDGNWATFVDLAHALESAIPEHDYNFALFQAIKHSAPFSVFQTLVANGGRFNYQHLFLMAQLDRHELYANLKSLGLDVHMTSPSGANALFAAMGPLKKNHTFLFLLIDGVDPNTRVNNRDLAQICLRFIIKTKVNNDGNTPSEQYWHAIRHFNRLVKYNARLEARHYQLLAHLREKRPKTFELLTSNAPKIVQALDDY